MIDKEEEKQLDINEGSDVIDYGPEIEALKSQIEALKADLEAAYKAILDNERAIVFSRRSDESLKSMMGDVITETIPDEFQTLDRAQDDSADTDVFVKVATGIEDGGGAYLGSGKVIESSFGYYELTDSAVKIYSGLCYIVGIKSTVDGNTFSRNVSIYIEIDRDSNAASLASAAGDAFPNGDDDTEVYPLWYVPSSGDPVDYRYTPRWVAGA